MIALAEQTVLGWAEETSWGQAALSGFKAIPLITENLTAARRQIRYQLLQPAHFGQKLINADERAGGEVELFPDIVMLRHILKTVLMTTITHHDMVDIFTSLTQNTITLSSDFANDLNPDDILWLVNSQTDKGQWVTFKPDATDSVSGELVASDGSTISRNSSRDLRLKRFEPGQINRSWTILKQYGDTDDWMQLDGMMIQRLELATTADHMLRANVNFTGKSMQITSGSRPAIEQPDQSMPIFLGASDIRLILRQSSGNMIDLTGQTDLSLKGFRLVLEQSGLSPRYGLGSRYPDAMLGGRLMVYGTIDLMGNHHEVLDWFSQSEPVQLFCQISVNQDFGFGFCVPQMVITDLSNAALISGEPVHHHLRFDAAARSAQGKSSLIHFYTS